MSTLNLSTLAGYEEEIADIRIKADLTDDELDSINEVYDEIQELELGRY